VLQFLVLCVPHRMRPSLLAHICATFFNKLRARLITFPIFVRWQHLIARIICKLFSSNCVVSHLNEACCIDELSRGSILRKKIHKLVINLKNSFLLVFCLSATNLLTMAAAGAIWCRHLTNGGINWLLVKPWTVVADCLLVHIT
jgi:hypothetical protein